MQVKREREKKDVFTRTDVMNSTPCKVAGLKFQGNIPTILVKVWRKYDVENEVIA